MALQLLCACCSWERVFHEDSGSYFFYNLFTGDVSWEDPRVLFKRQQVEAASAYQVGHVM